MCFSNCFHAYLINVKHTLMQAEIGISLCPRLLSFTVFWWRFFKADLIILKNELKSSFAGGINREKAKELTNYQQILSSVQCSIRKMPSFSRISWVFIKIAEIQGCMHKMIHGNTTIT